MNINYQIDMFKNKWWYNNIANIKKILVTDRDKYIYDLNTVDLKCKNISKNLSRVKKYFYAMKANSNIEVLYCIYNNGFGFECVSIEEIYYIKNIINGNPDILFTPNYCTINEYVIAFELNCTVIVDNEEVLINNPLIFSGKSIGLRLDLNIGDGHHVKVITEGYESKFGIALDRIPYILQYCSMKNIKIVGLHSHRGSDINNISNWENAIKLLKNISLSFNNIKWINIGGGFGTELKNNDLHNLNQILDNELDIWIEPGRYLVSEAGILVSKVNLVRQKGNIKFVGLSTGMNSLIRPTLYNAYHHIWNISNFDTASTEYYTVVGPICESGDVLGKDRLLPKTITDDIILIENAGAYGYVMSSNYNMRKPASEICLRVK